MQNKAFVARSNFKGPELVNTLAFILIIGLVFYFSSFKNFLAGQFDLFGIVLLVCLLFGCYIAYSMSRWTYIITDTEIKIRPEHSYLNSKNPLLISDIIKVELFKAHIADAKGLELISDSYLPIKLDSANTTLSDRVIVYTNKKFKSNFIGNALGLRNSAYFFSPENAEEFVLCLNSKLKKKS